MKYVMFEVIVGDVAVPNSSIKKKVPVIFPDDLVHQTVAGHFQMTLLHHGYEQANIKSAGSIKLRNADDVISCFGGSESLKVQANPEDAEVIALYDYEHGL